MPPIRKKDPLKSAQIEGKIQLALSDVKMEEFPIFVKLQGFMIFLVQLSEIDSKGIEYKGEKRANHYKLT